MPKRRLFYGWWVLLGIFISYTALVGVQVYTLPLFYPELRSEFGWSEESITLAATIFYLTGAFLTPIVSPLFDRYSARNFMIAGAFITVFGLFAYRWMESLLQLTMIYMVLALSQVCAGQVMETGNTVSQFVYFHRSPDVFFICGDETGRNCIGPFLRQKGQGV